MNQRAEQYKIIFSMNSLEHLRKCDMVNFLFLHLLKQKGKKWFQSQITWDVGFTPQSQPRVLLFVYFRYLHAPFKLLSS